ncbi:hypothetical protein [Mongoliimonas terrestris]|uniref:hypothetical protein n=1 Tax=Mongoliimonas terrestris TaxID=1709001 RepID=UPI00111540AE|nr:hypothetical protein [Mongoliimonas terrestris]
MLIDELTSIRPLGAAEGPARPEAHPDPMPLVEAAVAAAVGEERARAAAAAALAAAAADEARSAAVEAARRQWSETEGARLGRAIADGFTALERTLSDAAGRALAPVLAAGQRALMLAAFQDSVRTLLSDPDGRPFHIIGPPDLLAAVAAACPGLDGRATLEAGAGPELVVEADPTRIETRFAAWADRLAEAAGAR